MTSWRLQQVRKLLNLIEAEEECFAALSPAPVTIFLRIVVFVRSGTYLDRAESADRRERRDVRRHDVRAVVDPAARSVSGGGHRPTPDLRAGDIHVSARRH